MAGDMNISRKTNDSFSQLRIGDEHVANRAAFETIFIENLGMLDFFAYYMVTTRSVRIDRPANLGALEVTELIRYLLLNH